MTSNENIIITYFSHNLKCIDFDFVCFFVILGLYEGLIYTILNEFIYVAGILIDACVLSCILRYYTLARFL